MERLKWLLAFLLDVIIFTIAGIVVTVYHLIVGLTTTLLSTVKAIVLFDGLYLLCCIKTAFDLLTKYPIEAAEITFKRIKQSYDKPVLLSAKEGE